MNNSEEQPQNVIKELNADMSDIYAKDTGDVIDEYIGQDKKQDKSTELLEDKINSPEVRPQPVTEPPEYKIPIINKIRNYYSSSFRDQISNIMLSQEQLELMSIAELKSHLESVQNAVSMRCNKSFNEMIFFSGFSFIEATACKFGLEVQGFATIMRQEQEVQLLIEELGLKYQDYISVKPEYRLLGICLITLNKLHIQRRATKEISNSLSKPIPEATVNEYKDL